MSISEELNPSISHQKMEGPRHMREEMDGKVVYFPPESAFPLWFFKVVSTFPYLYLDVACKQLFPAKKKV